MKYTQPHTKHLRFDIDEKLYNSTFIQLQPNILGEIQIGKNIDSTTYWIGIIWRINYYLVGTNQDVIGYLGETKVTVISVGDKQTDLNELKQFISNSFLNVEIFLLEKLSPALPFPPVYPLQSIKLLAEQLLNYLDTTGHYV